MSRVWRKDTFFRGIESCIRHGTRTHKAGTDISILHILLIHTIVPSSAALYNDDEMEVRQMFNPKIRFTYDEKRLIIYALIDLKNRLLEEGRYTDPVDELILKFID